MSYAGLALGVIGAGFSAFGESQKVDAEAAQAAAQAQSAYMDQAVARQQGAAILRAERLKARRAQKQIAPGYAHAGVDVSSRSAIEVEMEAARLGEYNAKLASYEAELAAWRSGVQAKMYEDQADYIRGTKAMRVFSTAFQSLASTAGGAAGSGMLG
jgi:N-methylhydantoinase A/oxoprolinase/acetone carboxylase beta subunit